MASESLRGYESQFRDGSVVVVENTVLSTVGTLVLTCFNTVVGGQTKCA